MTKLINLIVFFLLFITGLLVVFYHFDLEIGLIRGKYIPFVQEIIWGVTGFIALLLIFRVTSKWSSLLFFHRIRNFKWEGNMSSKRVQWVLTVMSLELIFLFTFGTFFLFFDDISFILGLLLLTLTIEKGLFILFSKKMNAYRIGLSSKALLYFDKDLKTTPIINAIKVEAQSGELFFIDVNGMAHKFPLYAVKESDVKIFRQELETLLLDNNVMISQSFKNGFS